MSGIAENLATIRRKMMQSALRAGRNPDHIQLVAVSKTVGVEGIRQAWQSGITDFGENRVQDLVAKQRELPQARWHMIGHLQTNKVKDVIGRTVLIHSLDRWELAEYIERRAERDKIVVQTLLQVNVSGEISKGGVKPSEVSDFLHAIDNFRFVRVEGLMTMAPETDDPEETRPVFKEMRRLFDAIRGQEFGRVRMKYLSMGMTQDFEVAIEEGANMIRVGRALFDMDDKEG